MSDNFDNLSDYLDGVRGYSSERDGYGNDGYTVPAEAPAPSRPAPAPRVTGNAQVSPLRLGEFDVRQLCFARPLAALAAAYLTTMSEGRTADALGILSVYRALYNSQREAIVTGLSETAQRALPASLPEIAFTDAMRLSMQIVLSATGGGRADRNDALTRMPTSAAALGPWWSSVRSLFDAPAYRVYLEVPRRDDEELAPAVLRAVQADVDACLAPPSATPGFTVGPATGFAPCPPGYISAGPGRCVSASTAPGGSPPPGGGGGRRNDDGAPPRTPSGGNGSGMLFGFVLLLAAGAYWVYREETKKPRLAGDDEEE